MQMGRTTCNARWRDLPMLFCWIAVWVWSGVVTAADATGRESVTGTVDKAATVKPVATTLVNDPVSSQGILQLLLGLGLVVGFILMLAWLARRVGGVRGYSMGSMKVLGGMSMGAREKVVLMQVGNTQILLGVAPGRIQTLHVLDEPVGATAQPDAQEHGADTFAARLKTILKRTPE